MESAEEKSKLLIGISNMIENLVVIRKEKFLIDTDQMVYVHVTGTDNRIQGYTIYVTEIEIGTITTKVIGNSNIIELYQVPTDDNTREPS